MIEGLIPAQDAVPLPPRRVERAPDKPARDFRDSMQDNGVGRDQQPQGSAAAGIEQAAAQRGDTSGQSLLLPWQLVANNALSHLFMQGRSSLEGSVGLAAFAAGAGPTAVAASAAAGLASAALGSTPAGARLPQGGAATPVQALSTASVASTAERSETSAVLAGLADRWQERLLRWSANGLQGLSVRVRDYRLDADGQQALANRLVEFAQRNGLPLQRIVINARELWHAGTPIPPYTGEPHGR
ncbi:hypothetical protein [Stenotrophomonas sp. PD6]|uniref:hypothetical protein n=1 Tax=Stenotrophomonas sp. PD6 TaxID=3368612 RepID=UPI003BA33F2A